MDQNQHTCKNHPDSPAVAQCCVCGDWFCADCIATVGDKVYCKSHVQEAFSRDTAKGEEPPEISPYSRTTALILCFFFGLLGLHLFYTGYIKRGIANIVCSVVCPLLLGWLGIGFIPLAVIFFCTISDLIQIATGRAKDAEDRLICQ